MKQGPLPKVIKFDKYNQEETFLSEINNSNYSKNSVGVIVNTWYEGNKYAKYLKKAGFRMSLLNKMRARHYCQESK